MKPSVCPHGILGRAKCKLCRASYSRNWRLSNIKNRKEWEAEYRNKHFKEVKENNAKWRMKNQEKVKAAISKWRKRHPEKERVYKLRHVYNLSIEDFEFLLAAQNYGCKICATDKPSRHGTFYVDHDHKTGKIRGVLCHKCNTELGLYEKYQQPNPAFDDYLRRKTL